MWQLDSHERRKLILYDPGATSSSALRETVQTLPLRAKVHSQDGPWNSKMADGL